MDKEIKIVVWLLLVGFIISIWLILGLSKRITSLEDRTATLERQPIFSFPKSWEGKEWSK